MFAVLIIFMFLLILFFGSPPFRREEHIRFIEGEVERREALSIPGAERSRRARKRVRRGFGVCGARSCTSGIDRRSRAQLKTSP